MAALPELEFTYRRFIDKTTVLYGETDSGKSFTITDILYCLSPHIEQVIVVSPTDRTNHSYDCGIIPLPCIHYGMTPELLNNIWDRQTAFGTVYTRASNPAVMRRLFDKIPNNEHARAAIDKINEMRRATSAELAKEENGVTKTDAAEADCKDLIMRIFRRYISQNRKVLSGMQLDDQEQYTLKYINLNPRMVLIFDDCTDLIKKYRTHDVMQKLFYQSRHSFLTTLMACHNDKSLDPELKRNSFVSIFTEPTSAHTYVHRPSNSFTKPEMAAADEAIQSAFTPLAPNQKLAWVRKERKFYRFTATKKVGFRFGSPVIWDYCRQIQTTGVPSVMNNRFMRGFD